MNRMNRARTQGFTLIELLIVIAIIGILAAVLLPNYLGAQKRSQDVATVQCARAIVTAQTDYRARNGTYYNGALAGLGQDATESCAGIRLQPGAVGFVPTAASLGTGTIAGSSSTFIFWAWNPTGATGYYTDFSAGRKVTPSTSF